MFSLRTLASKEERLAIIHRAPQSILETRIRRGYDGFDREARVLLDRHRKRQAHTNRLS